MMITIITDNVNFSLKSHRATLRDLCCYGLYSIQLRNKFDAIVRFIFVRSDVFHRKKGECIYIQESIES